MNTKRKYFLLILLLILPVVFYSLSYVKVSKSLESIETPEILEDYDEENLVAADTSKACNKYSKSTCDGKIYTQGNIKYECAYGSGGAGCYAKYKYITSSTAGYYKCSGSCSYKKANDKIEASNTVCSGPYKTSLCGATPTYKAYYKTSSINKGWPLAEYAYCKIEDGKTSCSITFPDVHTVGEHKFSGWSTSSSCNTIAVSASTKQRNISSTITYYACFDKETSSSNTGYNVNKTAYITQDVKTNTHNLKKCTSVYVKTCQGNSQGAICSYTYNGENGTGLNTKYYSTSLPSGCTDANSYTLNAIRYITQDISSLGLKKCDTVYVKVCNGSAQGAVCTFDKDKKGGTSGRGLDAKYFATSKPSSCSSTPVQPVKTDDTVKTTINDDMYVIRDTGILNCGDKVRVTTCTSTGNNTTKVCDITIVNNKITSTQVDFSNLTNSYSDVPASCKEQTLYTTKTVPEYTSTSQIGNSASSKIPCGTMVTVENMATSCSYGPGKNYCEAKLNGKTVYIQSANLADAKPSECPTESDEMVCIYNSSKKDYKWVKKSEADNDYSNGYKDTEIANEADCKAPSDGEQSCTTSSKATDVTDEKKIINVCYEKKNDKITNDIDINTMYTCASDYTKNPAKLNEDTCKNIKDGTCHKSYVVSCSSAKRPGIEIASSLLNQGVGTITIRGRKVAADVKSYYLDEQKVPSNDSLWKDFSDANTVAYEQKPAGLYYAWVRDVNGLISRPMYAIVHDADITNTLKSLDVSDANDVALTLRAIDGTTANTDEIMPSNYALLSNRLNTDSTLAGFDSLSMGYEIDVNSSKISVYATLTSEDAKYVEGYEPRTVDLDYGRNTILIKIESNSGKVRTYTIIANRTDDRVNNNLLSDLTVSKGSISFDPYVTNYDINVGKNVKSVNINANLASDTSAFVSGFEPRSVDLNNDVTTAIIKTISETGSTRSYVLTFNKMLDEEEEVSNSALLDTLFIRGTVLGFNKEVFDYSVTIPYEYSFTEVYAFPESDNATVEISGNANLQVGANNIEIKVTNKNKTNVYNITVNRKEPGLDVSNDVTLSSLNVKGYKIDFKPEVLDYQVKIKRERSLIITATPTSNRSDVYMYGNNDLTGFSTVRVKVVAENGNTNIYSIDIQKDSYNKVLEVTATVIGSVIFLGAAIIIVVKKKNKKMKEYLGK